MPIAPAAPAAKPTSEIDRLRAELAAANAKLAKKNKVTFKVSEKGAVSVYGLGRFPTTLYVEQWESLFANIEPLKAFVTANRSRLKLKEE